MNYNYLEHLISKPRLDRYLRACGNSKARSRKLYHANLRIAQSFYPVLNLFEVILRNSIQHRLSIHFADPNWIRTQKQGFMSDPGLRTSNYYLRAQVQKAERKLTRKRMPLTPDRIIAEQTLGFWTSFFENHHYRLVKGSVIHCFPNKPPAVNRSSISTKLQVIRDFRNRVYHNEPICFNNHKIDFQNAEQARQEIFNLLSWMDQEAAKYVWTYSIIDRKIKLGKKV